MTLDEELRAKACESATHFPEVFANSKEIFADLLALAERQKADLAQARQEAEGWKDKAIEFTPDEANGLERLIQPVELLMVNNDIDPEIECAVRTLRRVLKAREALETIRRSEE